MPLLSARCDTRTKAHTLMHSPHGFPSRESIDRMQMPTCTMTNCEHDDACAVCSCKRAGPPNMQGHQSLSTSTHTSPDFGGMPMRGFGFAMTGFIHSVHCTPLSAPSTSRNSRAPRVLADR